MFCKFCGQTLNSGAVKCSRCGKEVPARSASGGFFQFTDGADAPVNKPEQPVSVPVKQPKQLPLLSLILAAVVVIALILIAVQGGRISRLEDQIKALDKDLSELTDELEEHRQNGHENEPIGTMPDVTEPDGTEPDSALPVVTEPNFTEPDLTEPSLTEPAPTQPDVMDTVVPTTGEENVPQEPDSAQSEDQGEGFI